MPEKDTTPTSPDVPSMIFEKFLKDLEDSGETAETLTALRKTLLEDKSFSEKSLRLGLFSQDQPK